MENVSKREIQKRGLSTSNVVLIGVLLAAGAVLRIFTPPFFGITPNFVIVMYCLAIYLIKPNFTETLGISIVAAAICHFTTKSMIPYINFISEPVGALVAFALVKARFSFALKNINFKPAAVTLLGTVASGLTYISILKSLILFIKTPKNPAFTFLLSVVVLTAVANTVIAQLIYYPIKTLAGKRD